MKKLLLLMLCAIMSLQGMKAQQAYTVFTGGTLTFYYDTKKGSRAGTPYDLPAPMSNPDWYEDGTCADVTKVVFDSSFADARPTSTGWWFINMKNLTTIEGMAEYLNTSQVTNMFDMFCGCEALTTIDVSKFNTAKVTDMGHMFDQCKSVTALNLSNFNTANVTNMYSMFMGCSNLKELDLRNFNTEKVTTMAQMFTGCTNLEKLNVDNFNTENVTSMYHMFSGTSIETLNLSSFNTAKVTSMGSMFYNCKNLTSLDLSNFNTFNVENMGFMFYGCKNLASLDLSSFSTINVENMAFMFDRCPSLTQLDLRSFNTSSVTSMSDMFSWCSSLETIYVSEKWSTEDVTESIEMFSGSTKLVGSKGTKYNAAHVDAAYAHIDGGTDNPGYLSAYRDEYAVYNDGTLTFYYDVDRLTRAGKAYLLSADRLWGKDGNNKNVTTVSFDPSFAEARPTSTASWFSGMNKLTTINGIEHLNTSEVTVMTSMFNGCSGLTSLDLSGFNTAKVTDMSYMFSGCSGLKSISFSSFGSSNIINAEKVTSMRDMFYNCEKLKSLDLSNFYTISVTDMREMFYNCESLTTIYVMPLLWKMKNVTDSEYMFFNCTNLVGGAGTKYDVAHTDGNYAQVDEPNYPGYFTDIDTPSGIATVGTSDNVGNAPVYDLQGRRINGQSSTVNGQCSMFNEHLPKGIYIVGGKKLLR